MDATTSEGASLYRVQDMLGNVREWTASEYYEHRGVARGHHFIGFRCATSEDLGEMAK